MKKTAEGRGMITLGKNLSKDKLGEIATMAVGLPRIPRRIPLPSRGSCMNIWKQDPSVEKLGVRQIYLHTHTVQGPKDSQIEVKGIRTVYPDIKGDFLFDPSSEKEFDAVHTYAVVRMVITMYQRATREKMSWQWGDQTPITIEPHAGETRNAFYSRNGKCLKFFYYKDPGSAPTDPYKYTCRSLDIVAHETGHALLDGLKPGWFGASEVQTGGLHESFGDLTAIFLALTQFDIVEYIISHTKGNLHKSSILNEVAEEFGDSIGRDSGLRNADNDETLSTVSPTSVHDMSQVFTGAIYDVLCSAFHAARRPRWIDDAVVLYEVSKKIITLTLEGIRQAPEQNATYKDVAEKMIAYAQAHPEEFDGYDDIITAEFTQREVLGTSAVTTLVQPFEGMSLNYEGCSGTMHHLANAEEAYQEFGPLREVG